MARKRSTFGSIDKRGKSSYRIRWTDENGEKQVETIRGTRAHAEDRLAEIRCGLWENPDGTTYDDYWASAVLPSMEGLADTTVEYYTKAWGRLREHIGSEYVERTDWRRVQQVLDTYTTYSSQLKAYATWRKIMGLAERDRLIDRSPVDRHIRTIPRNKREKVMLYADEIPGWMESIRDLKYEPVLLLILGGGLRPEEACALRWDDISLWVHKGRRYLLVNIDKAIVIVDNKAVEKPMPKNSSSVREVVVGEPFASAILRSMLNRPPGPIVPNLKGGPTSPSTIITNWSRWASRNGVKYVSMEDLRTVYSTNMGEAGAGDAVVGKAMGHAGTTTRERNYLNSTRRGLARIADMYTDLIEEALEEMSN